MTDTAAATELSACCCELLDWSKTGLLHDGKGGKVRARADALDSRINDHYRLRVAEDSVHNDAMRFVIEKDQLLSDLSSFKAEVERLREALEEIIKDAPDKYPDRGDFDESNYDDMVYFGMLAERFSSAKIARAALNKGA